MSEPSTRREFTKTLALLAAAPAVAAAQDPTVKLSVLTSTADALADIARIRYGKNLSEDQMKRVRASILRGLYAAERLKQMKLHNGDEPAVVFSADLP